jgi:hypothetical protein
MNKPTEAKEATGTPKPATHRTTELPVLVRVTRADRQRIASLLAR